MVTLSLTVSATVPLTVYRERRGGVRNDYAAPDLDPGVHVLVALDSDGAIQATHPVCLCEYFEKKPKPAIAGGRGGARPGPGD